MPNDNINCFLTMEIPQLCEWARQRKAYLKSKDPKWTVIYIAEKSGVGETTVDRFLNDRIEDLKFTTAMRIIRVLASAPDGLMFPCSTEDKEYSDLMRFKRLLAAGVISQEEFDAKRKQILGL